MTGTVRILAIDGGGIRGLIPATVLTHLERIAGVPTSRMFDMIAGTSTGAILAAGLTRPNPLSAASLSDLYISCGEDIFSQSPISYIRAAISGPKYDATTLERIMHVYFDGAMLSDCVTPLLVPCYDIERRTAYFFKSWRAAGHLNNPGETAASQNYALKDVVRVATAAPTYFAPGLIYSVGGDRLAAVDGALYANNPAMSALAEARVLFPQANRFILVSLGVGEFRKPIPYETAKNWGLLSWAPPVIDCAMDGAADAVDYQISQCFGANVEYHRFQISLNGPAGASDCIDDASDHNILKLINRAKALIAENADDLGRLAIRLPRGDYLLNTMGEA